MPRGSSNKPTLCSRDTQYRGWTVPSQRASVRTGRAFSQAPWRSLPSPQRLFIGLSTAEGKQGRPWATLRNQAACVQRPDTLSGLPGRDPQSLSPSLSSEQQDTSDTFSPSAVCGPALPASWRPVPLQGSPSGSTETPHSLAEDAAEPRSEGGRELRAKGCDRCTGRGSAGHRAPGAVPLTRLSILWNPLHNIKKWDPLPYLYGEEAAALYLAGSHQVRV